MKINVQIVDKKTGIYQYGTIDEPVKNGLEIENALAYFGIQYGNIDWEFTNDTFKCGNIQGTSKVVVVIK